MVMSNSSLNILLKYDSFILTILASNSNDNFTFSIIDKNTASSAEMLALIFKNYPNCLLVGSETKGLTTSNSNFPLNENLTLFLTTGRMLDSDKKYLEKIPADIFIKNIDLSNNKEVLSWFKEMN